MRRVERVRVGFTGIIERPVATVVGECPYFLSRFGQMEDRGSEIDDSHEGNRYFIIASPAFATIEP